MMGGKSTQMIGYVTADDGMNATYEKGKAIIEEGGAVMIHI